MSILRYAAWIVLTGFTAIAPSAAASGCDTNRTQGFRADTRFTRFAPGFTTAFTRRAPAAAWIVRAREIDCRGRLQAPGRAIELRVFALYGAREFSTFPGVAAPVGRLGETTMRDEPFDRQAEDPWLGFDKVQHLTFSFLWTLGTQYVAVNKGHLSESQALPISISTSAVIGLSKEYYDLRSGPTNIFSYKDLVANGVGILLATGLILL